MPCLQPQLCDLYENDSIFDKFDCCINGKGDAIATGSYNNLFRVFGIWNNQVCALWGQGGGYYAFDTMCGLSK